MTLVIDLINNLIRRIQKIENLRNEIFWEPYQDELYTIFKTYPFESDFRKILNGIYTLPDPNSNRVDHLPRGAILTENVRENVLDQEQYTYNFKKKTKLLDLLQKLLPECKGESIVKTEFNILLNKLNEEGYISPEEFNIVRNDCYNLLTNYLHNTEYISKIEKIRSYRINFQGNIPP